MKTVIVANPRAGSGKVARYWERVHRSIVEYFGDARVAFTCAPGDAARLVREALLQGDADQIVVVGGDGTFNEGLNGFVDDAGRPHRADATLALYPAGTGSDFARSIGLNGANTGDAYRHGMRRAIDIGRVTIHGEGGTETRRYFLNIASVGITGEVVARVGALTKFLGARAAYLVGTVRGLVAYRPARVRVEIDNDFEDELTITLVAVANGRYFGGSMKVAPGAVLDDGLFDVVIAAGWSVSRFVANLGRIYRGEHVYDSRVFVHRGRRVTITPLESNALPLEVDGELPGRGAVTFEVLPRAVNLFAPWSRAEAITHRGADAQIESA